MLRHYNCLDVVTTCELAITLHNLMTKKQLDYYHEHLQPLFAPLLSMMLHGIPGDRALMKRKKEEIEAEKISLMEAMEVDAGESLIAKVGISPKKLSKFIYETLKMPKQYHTSQGVKTLSLREGVLRKLMAMKPEAKEKIERVLRFREIAKKQEFYDEEVLDEDDRVRCSYLMTTDTGRLSSSKNPFRTGRNLQNLDRTARDPYIPLLGHVLLEVDLSQAESRVVGILSQDARLIEMAMTPPWEFDVHTFNAAQLFECEEKEVTKAQRYLGKRAVHASNYNMGPVMLQEILRNDGYDMSLGQCKELVERYHTKNPAIREWHKRTVTEAFQKGYLENSWGFRYSLEGIPLIDEMFGALYAFRPQSDIARLTNSQGLVPVHRFLKEKGLSSRLLAQIHDSLLMSCDVGELWEVYSFAKKSLETEHDYYGIEMSIPVSCAIGDRWSQMVEFKKPPTKEAFNKGVQLILGQGADGGLVANVDRKRRRVRGSRGVPSVGGTQ